METIQDQVIFIQEHEASPTANNENKRHNPGLKALLSMRNCHITLDKEYEELLNIEAELDAVNKSGLTQITTDDNADIQANWKNQVNNVDEAINGLKKSLEAEKEKIGKKEVTNFTDLWNSLSADVKKLREGSKKSANLGFEILPEALHTNWKDEFVSLQAPLTEQLISHVETCIVLLRMIEKYSPEELDVITKIVVDKIPLDFTYSEALVYEKDYFKALVDFKQEFKEEKNLWDKFLDILAGGTHQQPSEHVMMERWIEGEKGDLT